MGGLARELVSAGNCGTDYRNDNPQVLQAYNGLVAYEPLYQASCLKDKEGSYCELSLPLIYVKGHCCVFVDFADFTFRLRQRCYQHICNPRLISLLFTSWPAAGTRRTSDLQYVPPKRHGHIFCFCWQFHTAREQDIQRRRSADTS